jgi:hypothetical protein
MFVRRCAAVPGVLATPKPGEGELPAIKICSSRNGCRYRRSRNETFHLRMHLAGTIVFPKRLLADSPHLHSCYQIFAEYFSTKFLSYAKGNGPARRFEIRMRES